MARLSGLNTRSLTNSVPLGSRTSRPSTTMAGVLESFMVTNATLRLSELKIGMGGSWGEGPGSFQVATAFPSTVRDHTSADFDQNAIRWPSGLMTDLPTSSQGGPGRPSQT